MLGFFWSEFSTILTPRWDLNLEMLVPDAGRNNLSVQNKTPGGLFGLPSLKLTYPQKIDPRKRRFLLENIIFSGYVSFSECIHRNYRPFHRMPSSPPGDSSIFRIGNPNLKGLHLWLELVGGRTKLYIGLWTFLPSSIITNMAQYTHLFHWWFPYSRCNKTTLFNMSEVLLLFFFWGGDVSFL